MLALIGNVARAAGTARSASKMLPSRSTKKKGGALVISPQRPPTLTQFAGEAEKKKEQSRPSLNKSAFFRAPTIGDPKKGATKMKTVENKVSKISEFFAKTNKKRKEAFKSFLKSDQEEKRKEREAKRENFAKKLGKGIKDKALAPVKSIFDKILDAVGKIILAKIAMWAIDNPDAFIAIVKGIERIVTISTDIFIGTVDFMGTVINEGYKLVNGFNDWTEETLGQDVADTFDDLGGKLVNFLNAGLIVGGLLLARGQQELGEKPESPDKTKPEKSPTRKGPKKADKTTRTRRASKEARKRYARRYGKDAAKQRFGGKTRGPIKSSITRRGVGRSVTRLGIKMNPAMVKNMKSISKLAKGIKIPIIGPLVMGITSYLGDGNLGKAVFVALGTGIGELLGTAIPIPVVGTLLGGILGAFIGDLLYDIIVKKDPGAALKKVQDAAKKIFETGKAVFDWLKGSFGRFLESIPKQKIFGKETPLPDVGWLINPMNIMDKLGLLKDAFFPSQPNPPTPNLGDFSGEDVQRETSSGGAVQPQTAMITRLGSGAGSLKLTDQDYSDLAYIVSHEAARGTEDEYGVAAAVLNRVADPRYPDTIMGVGTAPGQFEAVFKGLAKRDPALAKKLKQNSGKIIAALKKLNGRTDFKGQSMLKFKGEGDVMFDPRGNFFHYAEQQAKSDPPPTNPPEHWKELLGTLSGGGSDGEARLQTEDNSEQAAALQTPSGQGPTSNAAAAVPTLSSSSTSQSSAVAKPAVAAQGMTPLPIPIGGQSAAPAGSSVVVSGGGRDGASLNSYYRSQLFGFLYKQG
jgi:hypothetical protein